MWPRGWLWWPWIRHARLSVAIAPESTHDVGTSHGAGIGHDAGAGQDSEEWSSFGCEKFRRSGNARTRN